MLAALRPSESASIPASVFVIGADDHGRVVAELAQACRYSRINFVDDCFPLTVGTISNLPDLVLRYSTVTVSLGNLPFRQELLDRLESLSLPIPALAHFSATVSLSSQIGPGSLMLPGAVVQTNAVVCKGAFFFRWSRHRPRCWLRLLCLRRCRSHRCRPRGSPCTGKKSTDDRVSPAVVPKGPFP